MALGKRKERDEEADGEAGLEHQEHHSSTLFVSNLPYNATSTDLQTLFSDVAPVRNAFVVCEQGTGVSKGVGYVSFAIREDAQMAYDKITNEGLTLVGRTLRIQWAEQKTRVKKEKTEVPSEKKARQPQPRAGKPQDALAIRTIVISGLSPSIDSKTLWKKIRKYQGAEKVEWPISLHEGNQDPSSAHAVFSTPALALDAVNKLHAHVFKGSLLSVTLKKRLEALASQKPSTKPSASTTAAPNRANRLIVRNLPFTAVEQDLRSIFLPYGPIYSINMPLKESSNPTSNTSESQNPVVKEEENDSQSITSPPTASTKLKLNKGFAFVWFYSRKDAERAIEGCNATLVRAGAAEELVKDKQKRKKEKRVEKKLVALAAQKDKEREGSVKREGEEGDKDEGEEEEKDGTKNGRGDVDKNERVIAVDWALSKDRWEEEKAKVEEEMRNDESEDEDQDKNQDESNEEDRSSQSGNESEDNSEGERNELGVHDDEESDGGGDNESGSEQGEEEEERDEDDGPVKPQLPQTDIGTTLFIRNVPYDATEDELRTLLRSFGPLRYARITMDPATGRSRGTGFACFWNKEDADKVIQQSEQLKAETTGGNVVPLPKMKNPFTLPSILTPDPSFSLAQNLVLHGRALDVARAVTRDEAGRLKEQGERAREKADKRNMYLLREGVILPNSPSASSLNPADLERRTNSYTARRALIKSNPSLYISKTRLSIRQIPLYVTERTFKRLAMHAARTFEQEVQEGGRKGLSEEELRDPGGRPGEQGSAQQDVEHARDDASEPGNESEPGSVASSRSISTSKSANRKTKLLKKLARSQRKGGFGPGVKQAKIVRQAERVDPTTGKGRSRGYGFIEMYTHADALRVLRWVNSNPEVHVLLRGWWKEELERLVQVEKGKSKGSEGKAEGRDDESDARLKRMIAELDKAKEREKRTGKGVKGEEGEEGKGSQGTLIVEFSIENVQVVQRRNALQKNKTANGTKEGPNVRKKMLDGGHRPSQKDEPVGGPASPPQPKKHGKKGKRTRDGGKDGDGAKEGSPKKRRRLST
ncbi:hypothetical protein AX15_003500 [Amanita polypyramis BW_CC]|nr:hypothetical protein AX15_003500 [Amanita polypyramis BW_CC]